MTKLITLILLLASPLSAEPLSKVISDILPFSVEGVRWQAEFHKVPIDEENGIFCSTGIAIYRPKPGLNEIITYEFKNKEHAFCEDIEFTRTRFTPDGNAIELPFIKEFTIQLLDEEGIVLTESQISSYDRKSILRTAVNMISNQTVSSTPYARGE